jgi:hypothetical protein
MVPHDERRRQGHGQRHDNLRLIGCFGSPDLTDPANGERYEKTSRRKLRVVRTRARDRRTYVSARSRLFSLLALGAFAADPQGKKFIQLQREISEPESQTMQLAQRADSVRSDLQQLAVFTVGVIQVERTVID